MSAVQQVQTTAYDRVLRALERHGCRFGSSTRDTDKIVAQCPAHEDRSPSLSVTRIESQVLVHCHAGCSIDAILDVLGLTKADLFDEPRGATYTYDDGRTVHRSPGKKFRQSGQDNTKPTTLYRLSQVTAAIAAGQTIYLVEGEKDVHALETLGVVATTAPMGAGSWGKVDASPLHGADLVVVVDADEKGYQWATDVATSLDGHARQLRFVRAAEGKDAADHVAAGHTLDEWAPYDDIPHADAKWLARQEALRAENDHESRVKRRLADLEVSEEAQRLLAAKKRASHPRPSLIRLDEFLSRPYDAPTYRIDEIWPTGSRIMLEAQFKAGKTTVVGNVLRALADGTDLFDRFPVRSGARIALIDDELDEGHLQRWLTDQAVTNQTAVRLVSLRGRLTTFDIRDPDLRAEWAADLTGADVILLDCLRPILDALDLDENHDAGKFLVHLDALLHESGASEALVVHHMGHGAERARGDSRLKDWPDASWKLVRDKDDENPDIDDVAGSRYFSAFGRDVNVPQAELTYDPANRRLTLGATALTRRESTAVRRAAKAEEAVLAAVAEHPGINVSKLRHDVRTFHGIGRNQDIDDAADRLVEKGLIYRVKAGNSKLHYPSGPTIPGTSAHDAQPAQDPPGQMGTNMPARPIGAGMYSHTPDNPNNESCPTPEDGHDHKETP